MLKIGNLVLDFPIVQAALSGYSDLPMRRVARMHGATYTLNEVVLDKLVIQRGKKQREITDVAPDDHPVGGQLMGAEPETFALAADAMVNAGYDVVDINFGCPVRKVLGRCRGGFLLSEPDTALAIVRGVLEAVGGRRPVTVKMRRGMDDSAESEQNFFRILDAAFELGIAGVTVHGRTVKQRYVGPSRWEFLRKVKQHVGDRTVLGSGDLFTAEDCVRMMEETGVDGVTVARGCIGNPWIFEECRRLMGLPISDFRFEISDSSSKAFASAAETGPTGESFNQQSEIQNQKWPPPTVTDQGRTIAQHFAWAVEAYGSDKAGKIMRKFGIKYSELHPHHMEVRDAFIRAKTTCDWTRVLDAWYDPAKDWAPGLRKTGPGDLIAAGAELTCED